MENVLLERPRSRPEKIHEILNSLDRYNTENISVLHAYVQQQAADGTSDLVSNLAVLKLYQFHPDAHREDIIIIILVKALIHFYREDFTTALHLLPAYLTCLDSPACGSLADKVQQLLHLYTLLDSASFTEFWRQFEANPFYRSIVRDVVGFEDDLRLSVANAVELTSRSVDVQTLSNWSNLSGNKLTDWVTKTLKWKMENSTVFIPLNPSNEAKPIHTMESLRFDQLSRIIKRAYEISA